MDKDKQGYIRYMHNTMGKSISAIARELGIARQTVRRALSNGTKKAPAKRPSKLDPFKEEIQRLLEANPNLTNVLILEKIRQSGYQGGKSILGDYLQQLRPKVSPSFLHIETMPGKQAQVDWAYAGEISVGEHKRKLYLFCMVLSYSRHFYFEPTVSMKHDIFLACHINAFRFFGGVPQTIVYDNLKSVVLSRLGKDIRFNPSMLDFAGYYGFKLKVCNPRAPQEKGKVERTIAYITNNFMQREAYHDFKHIRYEAPLWLKNTACKRKHATTGKIPLEVFEKQEKSFLLPLPQKPYDYARPTVIHPQKDGLFRFDANRYSVPEDFIHQPLTLKAYQDVLKVYHKEQLICQHNRCYDKYQTIKDLNHYRKRLSRIKRYKHQTLILHFKNLCPEAEAYLAGLHQRQAQVIYHVRQILNLEVIFGKSALCSALIKALKAGAFHWESIKNILLYDDSLKPRLSLVHPQKKDLMELEVEAVDLSKYDRLLKQEE